MAERRERKIQVPVLARVEGEGALDLCVRDGRIDELKLRIYEPPRLFEQFLVGHSYAEVPDLVPRICGICPVAYQMSAVNALEALCEAAPGPWVRTMRRLFYCGEWLQSHALHIHLLAAPDFLGFESAIAMASRYGDEVRRGLRLQALGNEIIRLLGARSVHPVGARVGGLWDAPDPAAADDLGSRLEAALAEYRVPDRPYLDLTPAAGSGCGASEAPRGLLWHRYDLSDTGLIDYARIVPPTSQNQGRIEEDLRLSLTAVGLDRDADTLRHTGEMVIRNYDPCISCATHFLRLNLDR
jgi:coenzyme F420-reducing hydrogenase alpha subunit